MDQYLQWDSHHHLSAKYSVIAHRTKQYTTGQRNGLPQKGTQSLQVPQMGHGQGGKKVLRLGLDLGLPVRKGTMPTPRTLLVLSLPPLM